MKTISVILLGIIFSMNVSAKITFDTIYSNQWNSNVSDWESFDRTISSKKDGKIISELIQLYENSEWINYNFITYTYNNDLVIHEMEQYWDDFDLKWEDNYRKLYSYDINGNLIQITHQNIYKGNYINSSREIMIYNEEGKLKEKVIQQFEEAWDNFLKYQYYYNADDLLIEENLANWENDSWNDASFSLVYAYNSNGKLVEKVKQKVTGSETKNILKEQYLYDKEGLLDEHIASIWSSRKKRWENKNRAVYTDEMNGFLVSMADNRGKREDWNNYFFTGFSGSREAIPEIEFPEGLTFSVYPSNFGMEATIEFSNPYNEFYLVQVINEFGQLMGSATTNKEEISIDASKLIKGLYFVELQGSNLYSGKFSIE